MIADANRIIRNLTFVAALTSTYTFGQITGNTNVVDPMALKIDGGVLNMLMGKKWKCEDVIETRRGEVINYGSDIRIEFLLGGKIINTIFRNDSGAWKVVNTQYLILSWPQKNHSRWRLAGSFSIYKVSDSIALLAQVLTSNGDWRKEYLFKNQKYTSRVDSLKKIPFRAPYFPLEDSLREGKRVKHDEDGRRIETYYTIIRQKISMEEAFLNRWKLNDARLNHSDSTYTRSVETGPRSVYSVNGVLLERQFFNERGSHLFTDSYVYASDGTLSHIQRGIRKSYKVVLPDSILLDSHKLMITGREGSTYHHSLKIKSLSEHDVPFHLSENLSLALGAGNFLIKARDSLLLILNPKLPPGDSREKIYIGNGNWKFPIEFNTFGYHMTVDDFNTEDPMTLPMLFYFHRSDEEYQLQIERIGAPKSQRFFPISMQMVPIELKKGRYLFTLSSPSLQKKKQVEIK
jgi:hypothetical protein